jgi:hypothetical protein
MAESNYFTAATDKWLAARVGKITSSRCSVLFVGSKKKDVLFGDTAMTYLCSVIDEITTGEIKEEVNFKQTEWGKANEFDAIGHFEAITGLKVDYHGITNPDFVKYGDFAGGSPDGVIIDKVEDAICECKCHWDGAVHMKKLLIKSVDEFKDKFWEEYCQDQMNMKVTGKTNCYSISYDPRKKDPALRTKIIKVPIDIEWQQEFDKRLTAAIEIIADLYSEIGNYLIVK